MLPAIFDYATMFKEKVVFLITAKVERDRTV